MNDIDYMNQVTAREYWQATRNHVKLFVDDDKEVEQITSDIVNRSYNHYVQYFARQPELLKSYQLHFHADGTTRQGK